MESSHKLGNLLPMPSTARIVKHKHRYPPGVKADLVAKPGYYLIETVPAGVKWILKTKADFLLARLRTF